MGYNNTIKTVYFQNNLTSGISIDGLEKIGSGYDGIVYKYGNLVLKIIKYDMNYRSQKVLMTFKKAVYFKDKLDLKRITQPIDILFDYNGFFSGYVMRYVEDVTILEKNIGDFTCGEFLESSNLLKEDFNNLTKNNVLAKDINPASIIYSQNFINLCDIDKYVILENGNSNIEISNRDKFYYVLAKVLYFTMRSVDNLEKQQLKELYRWIKKASHRSDFLLELEQEINGCYGQPMSEYAKYKLKQIIK